MLLNYLLFFILITTISCGIIFPCGTKPISLGFNNQNRYSSYTFTFFIETDLFSGDYIWIYFPSEFTTIPAGDCSAYLLAEDASYYNSPTKLSCSFTISGNYFKITTPELKGSAYSNHTILIDKIMNPSTGGTGSFRIETRRGDLNLLDYNHNFETIAIVGDPNTIATASFTRTKSQVNDIADYVFTVSTISLTPKNGSVLLYVSGGELLFSQTSTCATSLSTTVSCSFKDTKTLVFYVSFISKI